MDIIIRILIETGCILAACFIAFVIVAILDSIECKIKKRKKK